MYIWEKKWRGLMFIFERRLYGGSVCSLGRRSKQASAGTLTIADHDGDRTQIIFIPSPTY